MDANTEGTPADLTCRVQISIARDAVAVFDMITDLSRMGEWSPTCKACWLDEGRPMGVGSWFTGRNEEAGRTSQSRNEIVAFEPQRVFAFHTGGDPGRDLVRWQYDVEPRDGATMVAESWTLLPAGIALFEQVFGDEADMEMRAKQIWARDAIAATLSEIKRVAESGR